MSESIPMTNSVWVWGFGILILLPLTVTALALLASTGSIVGDHSSRTWAIGAYVVIAIVGGFLLSAVSRNQVEVQGGTVAMRGALLYSRSVPLNEIVTESVQIHDGSVTRPALGFRVNGMGFPGYVAGWFRRSGNKVFAIYGGGSWVSFATKDGVQHVIGTDEPQRLSSALTKSG